MSLFKKTFQPKKAPVRKTITISPLNLDATERAREFGLEFGSAQLRLGDQVMKFDLDTGEWYSEGHTSGTASTKEVQKLQRTNLQLQEENNLLKVKTEVLTDMVAEIYCENKLSKEQKSKK